MGKRLAAWMLVVLLSVGWAWTPALAEPCGAPAGECCGCCGCDTPDGCSGPCQVRPADPILALVLLPAPPTSCPPAAGGQRFRPDPARAAQFRPAPLPRGRSRAPDQELGLTLHHLDFPPPR